MKKVAYRTTRLHDEKGNLAAPAELARVPLILLEAMGRRLFGRLPARPLLSHSATKSLAARLTPSSHVIEFGSGASTLWLAQRVGSLVSYETVTQWYDRVSTMLEQHNVTNTTLVLWDGGALAPQDKPPNLIIIDGHKRDLCAEYAIQIAGPETYIFLDNCDKDLFPPDPEREMRRCEKLLKDFAADTGRHIEYFTGFAPAQLYAEQSMLVGLPDTTPKAVD